MTTTPALGYDVVGFTGALNYPVEFGDDEVCCMVKIIRKTGDGGWVAVHFEDGSGV